MAPCVPPSRRRSIIPYEERLLQAGSCSMSAGAGKVGFLTHLSEGELYWSAFATDEAIAESGLVRDPAAPLSPSLP